MLMRRYEMPWRRAYEVYAAAVWASTLLFFAVTGGLGLLPRQLALPLAGFCLAMGVLRLAQGVHTLVLRASLSGRGIQVLSTRAVARWTEKPDAVFLGFGFEWRPVHSQRLYELAKVDYREFTVSPRLLQVLGYDARPQPDAEIGLPYIHGVEPREVALHRPLQNFEGGTLLVGTTQSGKGVALANLVTQAVRRGDVVIVIDPKNSRRLKRVTQRACEDWRDPDTFLEFHPAFPEAGVRLDFTFNWQKPTEIASRIQSIMPTDTAGAFSAFGWDAVNVVVQGLVELEERPNLVKLTKYIEGGIEPVLEATLRRFYERLLGAGWRDQPEMKKLLHDAHRGNMKRPSEAASADLLALVAFYEHHVPQSQRNKVLDAQVRTFRHNREHYQKITANLLPVLSMLTSGDLGRSLSP
uniref:conjugative transfer system coupling protein TraD n=1 Tax=uncultured Aquincola sp. TaxID=886556 RepID=UPI0032B247F2